MQKPTAIDNLVENFIADLCLYMMRQMGPERAEEFKAKNFGYGTSIKEISHLIGNK